MIPTWTVEMKRTGSSISRSAVRAPRPPRERSLLEPAPSRGDERVLRRDEDRVPEDQQEDDDDAERSAHARPATGCGRIT